VKQLSDLSSPGVERGPANPDVTERLSAGGRIVCALIAHSLKLKVKKLSAFEIS
jgi:hypothetical protein